MALLAPTAMSSKRSHMKNNPNADLWLSRIGFGLILCYCFLASILFSYFAQIHLSLSFLPFPIFVGEIVMFISLALLGLISKDGLFNRRTIILLGLYFGWVMVRALVDYHHDGPLAARNAALFYYPIFAVFAYVFYQKARVSRNFLMSLAFLASGILFFKQMILWYWWTYLMLLVIAVWNAKTFPWRWLGLIFLAAILLLGKEYFYQGARAHVVGVLGSIIFLGLYFGTLFSKHRNYVPLCGLLVTFFIFILGYFVFAEHNAFSSLTSLKRLVDKYNEIDKRYQSMQGSYVPKKLSVHLYNPKKLEYTFLSAPSVVPLPSVTDSDTFYLAMPDLENHQAAAPGHVVPVNISKQILHSEIIQKRTLAVDENNIVFRLFIWRDMARELIEKKAWWGFSFGHPQRSKSLEVLDWAKSEWRRDGWIAPHNSFFHIIYRAGILGVFLIIVLFSLMAKLTKDFLSLESVEGGLLVSALVYWLILSNFFVILEFPYNAIVFWTLFGVACVYRDEIKKQL